jgi:predicted nucleotide-binding protein
MKVDFSLIAVKFGDSVKYNSSINQINRIAGAIFNFEKIYFENKNISSSRAQEIYDWILSLKKTDKYDDKEKISKLLQFIREIDPENGEKFISNNFKFDQKIKNEENVKPSSPESRSLEPSSNVNPNNRIFLVHGHDDGLKNEIARYLEQIRLEVVILHEQANHGQTIIEKFENNSNNVDLAIVLLSGDDVGKGIDEDNYKKRARQNVIFELGYFFGRLGRNKVIVVRKDDIENPSDYQGIIYINYKSGWKLDLIKELKAIGINYDQTKIV